MLLEWGWWRRCALKRKSRHFDDFCFHRLQKLSNWQVLVAPVMKSSKWLFCYSVAVIWHKAFSFCLKAFRILFNKDTLLSKRSHGKHFSENISCVYYASFVVGALWKHIPLFRSVDQHIIYTIWEKNVILYASTLGILANKDVLFFTQIPRTCFATIHISNIWRYPLIVSTFQVKRNALYVFSLAVMCYELDLWHFFTLRWKHSFTWW